MFGRLENLPTEPTPSDRPRVRTRLLQILRHSVVSIARVLSNLSKSRVRLFKGRQRERVFSPRRGTKRRRRERRKRCSPGKRRRSGRAGVKMRVRTNIYTYIYIEREKERALYKCKCSKSRAYFDVQNPRDRLHKFCIFDAPPQSLFPRFARRGFRAQSTRKRNT